MKIRNWIKKLSSLSYIVDKMDFSSSIGKTVFMNREYSSNIDDLNYWYDLQDNFVKINTAENRARIETLKSYIREVKDIRGTLLTLQNDGVVTEIELFEIKRIVYYSERISEILNLIGFSEIQLESLLPVFEILDPLQTKVLSFHIYDEYSEELKMLRNTLRTSPKDQCEVLYAKIDKEQVKVLTHLSGKLCGYIVTINSVISKIATIDFLVAATSLYAMYGMTRAIFSKDIIDIKSMFNPLIMDRISSCNGVYQRVDISFGNAPTLICGANMSGKSVVLNTVALCQLMAQFGMYIVAQKAVLMLKDTILLSLNDDSAIDSGLSSFGCEILSINQMINSVVDGVNPLILIDEAARTTNPVEGVAIVSALIDVFNQNNISALITTHYSGIEVECRNLRVKGIKENAINEQVTINNINKYIDYSLEECDVNKAPQEAIRIAEMLGVNDVFISKIKQYVK